MQTYITNQNNYHYLPNSYALQMWNLEYDNQRIIISLVILPFLWKWWERQVLFANCKQIDDNPLLCKHISFLYYKSDLELLVHHEWCELSSCKGWLGILFSSGRWLWGINSIRLERLLSFLFFPLGPLFPLTKSLRCSLDRRCSISHLRCLQSFVQWSMSLWKEQYLLGSLNGAFIGYGQFTWFMRSILCTALDNDTRNEGPLKGDNILSYVLSLSLGVTNSLK